MPSIPNVSQGSVLCVWQCVLQCVLQYMLQYALQHLSIFELEDIVSLGNTVPKFIHDDVLTGFFAQKSAFQSFYRDISHFLDTGIAIFLIYR